MIIDMDSMDNLSHAIQEQPVATYQATASATHDDKFHVIFNPSIVTTTGATVAFYSVGDAGSTATIGIREFSQEYARLLDKLPWMSKFFCESAELTDVKSLLPYYKEINSLIANRDFSTCDTFLNNVRARNLSDVLLVGLLRLTANWKNDLPTWSNLLERSHKELNNRGHDSENMLKGLS